MIFITYSVNGICLNNKIIFVLLVLYIYLYSVYSDRKKKNYSRIPPHSLSSCVAGCCGTVLILPDYQVITGIVYL